MDFFVAPLSESERLAGAPDESQAQPLNERYSFDTFVIGKSNELAAAAAPRSHQQNPLCRGRAVHQ
jgi:chromosomal replication initiation ATPase DnaA